MILSLFSRNRQETTIRSLYGTIVAQARRPSFYRDHGVPDTINGRFDMILLHLALFLDRTEAAGEPARILGQGVFDLFCREMDGHFRETGVSDLKVPNEMRRMAEAFYGRRAAYRAALVAPDYTALAQALLRNIYLEDSHAKADAAWLAAYVRIASESLAWEDRMEKGQLAWPDPATISINDAVRKRG